MFFKSKQLLGLDIGSNSIKLAKLELSKGKGKLDHFYFAPTPSGLIDGGEILGHQEAINIIGNLITQYNVKSKNIAVNVWGSGVVVKRIIIPKMDLKLLQEQIKFEAEQYIPFSLDEVNIEYQVLKKQNSQPDTMEVLLVAARKDMIMGYAEIIESSGLSLQTIDVSGFALANTFLFNYPNPGVQHIGLLNFGSTSCNFVVIHNSEVVFCRDIPVGGLNFTQDIEKSMGLSFSEAESLKLSLSSSDCPPETLDVVKQTTDSVVEELKRNIDFYSNSSGSSNPIQKYFISGGASQTLGLQDALQKGLEAPIEILNPFINISFNPNNITPDYAAQISPYAPIALGLAMRKIGDEK